MLKILPCLDSEQLATTRRVELDIPQALAAELGRTAVVGSLKGTLASTDGAAVDIRQQVQLACSRKVSIPPDARLPNREFTAFTETRVQVANETTLGASWRLANEGRTPLALNFANGIHPGGGVLSGARAQEEVLCRSSALYQTLVDDPMYEAHRQRPLPDSTDWVIYSPEVPVFRTDDGSPLRNPRLLSFVTCAAPYAPTVGQPRAGDLLARRIRRVLAIAHAYGYTALVLGAWGCGAFRNDVRRTAKDFRDALENEFSGAFSDIVFAISDWSPERIYLGPFRDVFDDRDG